LRISRELPRAAGRRRCGRTSPRPPRNVKSTGSPRKSNSSSRSSPTSSACRPKSAPPPSTESWKSVMPSSRCCSPSARTGPEPEVQYCVQYASVRFRTNGPADPMRPVSAEPADIDETAGPRLRALPTSCGGSLSHAAPDCCNVSINLEVGPRGYGQSLATAWNKVGDPTYQSFGRNYQAGADSAPFHRHGAENRHGSSPSWPRSRRGMRRAMAETNHEAAVVEFIRRRGITRCPTACVLPIQGSPAAADRAALAEYAMARDRVRRAKVAAHPQFRVGDVSSSARR